jgi:RNA polymerase sigma-70 factor (ECF subfamily)
MLETSVAGVNSALQRARTTLAQERDNGQLTRSHTSPGTAIEQALVRRLVDAWHVADVPAIVAILTEDALFTMPPLPNRYVGREAIGAFLASGPARGRLDRFRLVPTRANRQPAVAAYYRDRDSGPFLAHGVIVLAFDGAAISSLVRFGDETLFQHFGLPPSIDGETNARRT